MDRLTIKIFFHDLNLKLMQCWKVRHVKSAFSQNIFEFVKIKLRQLKYFRLANFVDRRSEKEIQQIDGWMSNTTELKIKLEKKYLKLGENFNLVFIQESSRSVFLVDRIGTLNCSATSRRESKLSFLLPCYQKLCLHSQANSSLKFLIS